MNINVLNFVRFKGFLAVVERPAGSILYSALHTAQCYMTAAAYQAVQMFTPLQNDVTKK